MENKLQQLTQKLYDEGLSKGRQEAEALVANAQAKAKQIVADAQAEAERINKEARDNAEELRKNTLTELSLAGKQVVTTLKESVQEMIVTKAVNGAVAQANLDPEFVKEVLIAVAKNWKGDSSDQISLKALLPADKQAALGEAFEKSVRAALGDGIEIEYKEGVKSGFRIGPKEGGYYISFTDADFDALLGEYLRPKVSAILYGEQK